jgi:uncharacterized repeat protein (TIGR01451 family)
LKKGHLAALVLLAVAMVGLFPGCASRPASTAPAPTAIPLPSLNTAPPPTPMPTAASTLAPTSPAAPAVTPTAQHLLWPDAPARVTSYITDATTYALRDARTSYGDRFSLDVYERPYTSLTMDYLAHVDIQYGALDVQDPWIYVTFHLMGEPPLDSNATYALEIDLDLDGRGDWLIIAIPPPSTQWTTDGVFAWQDADNDVGGATPLRADRPSPERNGYEELVFDQGRGADPDTAWVRRVPGEPRRVQIAFKHALIEGAETFLWGLVAEQNGNLPAWYDFNDHFLYEVAGSPRLGDAEYPVQALAALDSTCRFAVGFTPNGAEPGICGGLEADLSVVKSINPPGPLAPGSPITYTIRVANLGPALVKGASVTDDFPLDLENVTWTCASTGGATCAGGSGGILHDAVNLPIGSTITYTVNATLGALASGSITNTARITSPANIVDPDTGNNASSVVTPIAD